MNLGRLAWSALLVCAVASHAFAQGGPALPTSPDALSGGGTSIPVMGPERAETLSAENTGVSAKAPGFSLEEPLNPDTYICGPGDEFELNFWGQQNFRLRMSADLEGRVFVSKVGFVQVASKTLSAVRADIRKKVRSQYPGLQFEITLVTPRTFVVHVVNSVRTPGAFTGNPLERVSTLVARAGGSLGSKRRISVRHKNGRVVTADLVMYELTGDTTFNPFVLDGDVIDVPSTEFVATIAGAVRRPGTYELVKTKDLAELVQVAGGLSPSVARTLPARITRRGQDQRDKQLLVALGTEGLPEQKLQAEDRVIIRSSDELQRSVLLIGAVVGAESLDAATTSKRLSFVDGDTVSSLIERAGGIRAPGDLRRAYIARSAGDGKQPTLIPLDLEALLVRRDLKADKPVQVDDTIVVPPMQYSVLVEGAVARPGLYNYNPMFGIAEYVAHAGGRTRTAQDLDDARIIDPDGRTHDFSASAKLKPGDAILIPERNFSRPEIVQIVLAGAGLILSGVAITLAATR